MKASGSQARRDRGEVTWAALNAQGTRTRAVGLLRARDVVYLLVTSANRYMAARLSSAVKCVYWRDLRCSDPLRDHFAHSVHAQLHYALERDVVKISGACFRSLVFVDRKTRLLVWVSGFRIENAQNRYGLPSW